MSSRIIGAGALVACLLSALSVQANEVAQEAALKQALFEADVVRLSAKHNPTLRSALLQAESARWDASGLEAQYAPVIAADLSATQAANPNLVRQLTPVTSGSGAPTSFTTRALVTTNRVRRADAGAELRKHTVWGTDLTLRVATNVHQTYYSQSFGTIPQGSFGPGVGALVKLSLKQPLMRGRGRAVNEAALLASRVKRNTIEHTRDRVASEVLRDALSAYWELWYATATVKIEEQARAVAEQQRVQAQARVDTGSLAPAEVFAFDTQVATREESLLSARLTHRQRELELSEKMGVIGAGELDGAEAESEPIATLPARDVSERMALSESAELKELYSSLELAVLQAKTASDSQRAKLDLDSYLQAQGMGYQEMAAALGQISDLSAVSGYVGLTFEAPVNRRRERAEAAKARIATEVAEQNLRQGRQRIAAQVALLHERGRSGEQALVLAERTLDIARKQLAAEQARYATGSSTAVQVLEAEDKVRGAELRVARQRADFMQSVLSMSHYTGELLTRYASFLEDA